MKSERQKERYYWLKEHGICVQCGQRNAFSGYVRCAECIEKVNLAAAKCWDNKEKRESYNIRGNQKHWELYQQRKTKGLCVRCGKPAKIGVLCEWCKNKRNARRKTGRVPGERFRERIAAGVCMYCGEEVVPGYHLCEMHLAAKREHIRKIQHKSSEKWRKEIETEWNLNKLKHSGNG